MKELYERYSKVGDALIHALTKGSNAFISSDDDWACPFIAGVIIKLLWALVASYRKDNLSYKQIEDITPVLKPERDIFSYSDGIKQAIPDVISKLIDFTGESGGVILDYSEITFQHIFKGKRWQLGLIEDKGGVYDGIEYDELSSFYRSDSVRDTGRVDDESMAEFLSCLERQLDDWMIPECLIEPMIQKILSKGEGLLWTTPVAGEDIRIWNEDPTYELMDFVIGEIDQFPRKLLAEAFFEMTGLSRDGISEKEVPKFIDACNSAVLIPELCASNLGLPRQYVTLKSESLGFLFRKKEKLKQSLPDLLREEVNDFFKAVDERGIVLPFFCESRHDVVEVQGEKSMLYMLFSCIYDSSGFGYGCDTPGNIAIPDLGGLVLLDWADSLCERIASYFKERRRENAETGELLQAGRSAKTYKAA